MVKHITYKEEKLPIRVSYRALKALSGQGLDKMMSGNFEITTFETLLWGALQSGHKAEGKELKLTETDMEDVLEECFQEFVLLMPLFFPKAEKGGNENPNPVNKDKIIVKPA